MIDDAIALIETMRWEAGIELFDLHIDRLRSSARALNFRFEEAEARSLIASECRKLEAHTAHRVRLELSRQGGMVIEIRPFHPPGPGRLRVKLAESRLDSGNPLLRHKTTRRHAHEREYASAIEAGFDEVLFLNERGEVCEGSRTNIVIERHERWLTPAIRSGLLPGVYRRHLMQQNPQMEEAVLTVDDLIRADKVFVCNAVWGRIEAELDADMGFSPS